MHRPITRALLGTPQHPQLIFRRHYDASAADVLDACTDPQRLARWYGEIEGDPSAVGDTFTAHLGDEDDDAVGRILSCDPQGFSISWSWQGEAPSVIRVGVADLPSGRSELTIDHALAEPEHGAGYGGGWEQMLQSLSRQIGDAAADAPTDEMIERDAVTGWRTLLGGPLELTRDLDAPVERVWEAFASADGLRRWWWTHWDDVEITADVCPGGTYRITSPSEDIVLTGTYLAIEPGRRLAFSWSWTDADGTTEDEAVDVRMQPADDGAGTALSVRHTGPWSDGTAAENYRQGWEFTLDALTGTLGQG